MDLIIYLGLLAGILTTISVLPQVIKSWKTKKTNDLSLSMYLILTTGVTLWIIYGLITKDLPVLLANSATLILLLFVIFLKRRYG